jgi:2',3'-cyclic-nucleotide 2'-phosphodiesterase/3'-nucleotidase
MRLPAVFLILVIIVSGTARAREARITVLATSDLHGNVLPWDYLSGEPVRRGLASIATIINRERNSAPGALLVDAGDTIQGAPMETVWQTYVRTGKLPMNLRWDGPPPAIDPMMLVMNHLRYDSMTLGNHEFNYGLANLERARSEAKFPWLSANTKVPAGRKPFLPLIVRTVDGVKVGIIGVTTPGIPNWEKPENFRGYAFTNPRTAVAAAVSDLRSRRKADIVIVVAHAGLDRDLTTGAQHAGELANENTVYQLASEVPGIDAIVFGHTHSELGEAFVNGVLLTQPKNWGVSLARIDLVLEAKMDGSGWEVKSKHSRLIPVTPSIQPDAEVLRLAQPYHEVTERYLNSPVTRSAVAMSASRSRVEDTPIIDAIQTVQLHYARADVSFTSSFNPRAEIPKGPVTVRQIAGLYIYDNELYAVEGNGRMVRDALENAARYFVSCSEPSCSQGSLINRDFIGFNYDMAGGVSYVLDLMQPEGQRVRNLKFRGAPLADNQKLRLALNSYRAAGSGGYTMFPKAPVVWRSFDDIRHLMIEYYAEHALPAAADQNWKIVPESARAQLKREAHRLASRPETR